MDVESIVVSEIAMACGLEKTEISKDSWLVEHGIDSVKSIDIIMSLEDKFEISVDDEDMEKIVTVVDVINLVHDKTVSSDS